MRENKKMFDHLMDGITAMIPFVVAGGMLMALGFSISGVAAMSYPKDGIGSFGQVLYNIGSQYTMSLMFLATAGFIARSIGGEKAFLAGFVGGAISNGNGSSFIGAVIAGFLAGFVVVLMEKHIKLPEKISGINDLLIVPIVSTLIVGLASVYIVGIPVSFIMKFLTSMLSGLGGGNLIVLCVVLSIMMVADLCGPLLRVAYVFSIAAVTASPGVPQTCMAAVIAAGLTAPLGMAIATTINKRKFTETEIEAGKAAWILGACFIVEGVIPFEMRDPKRVIPSCCIGAAAAGAIIALFETGTTLVHGGIFLLLIPGALRRPAGFILAIVVGSVITATLTLLLKRPIAIEKVEENDVVGQV